MAAEIEFEVNGEHRRVPDNGASLLLSLRNDLSLKGTRHGCTTGHCGACTILLEGRAESSCNLSLDAVAGKRVETIEALRDDPIGKVLFNAFMNAQAGQCGYCLPGILLEAKALLSSSEAPGREEIAKALDSHLCRCGAHHRILAAIEGAGRTLAGKEGIGA